MEEEIDYNFREKELAAGQPALGPEHAGPGHARPLQVGPAGFVPVDIERLLAKTREFCRFLERRKDDEVDAVEVKAGTSVICIGAGEQQAVAGVGPLECRAARDGGLRLVDQSGVSIGFLRDFRPQWVKTTHPAVTARLAFPDAQSCQDACDAAAARLNTLIHENPAAISADTLKSLQAWLQTARQNCQRRFWISRVKTVTFDLWQCATRGSALARDLQATDFILNEEFPGEEPNARKETLLEQWSDRAGRVRQQLHKLRLLVTAAEQLLAMTPPTDAARAAADQLRPALTSAGSQERVWVGLCKKRRLG
jgi:hypothetical protein